MSQVRSLPGGGRRRSCLLNLYLTFSLHVSSTTSSSVVERGTVDRSPGRRFDPCLVDSSALVEEQQRFFKFPALFYSFPALPPFSTPSPLFRPPALPLPPCPFLPSLRPIVSTAFRHLVRHYSTSKQGSPPSITSLGALAV